MVAPIEITRTPKETDDSITTLESNVDSISIPGQTTTSDNGTTTIKANDNVDQVANGSGDNHAFTFGDSESGNLWTVGQSKTLFNNSTEVVIAAGANGSFFEFLVPLATATVKCTVAGVGTTEFSYSDDKEMLSPKVISKFSVDDWSTLNNGVNRLRTPLTYNSGDASTFNTTLDDSRGGIGRCRTQSNASGEGHHDCEDCFFIISEGGIALRTRIRFTSLGVNPEEYVGWCGFIDATGAGSGSAPNNKIRISFDPASSANLLPATFNGGTEYNASGGSSVSVSINTWYEIIIIISSTGDRVDFYADQTYLGNIINDETTRIPQDDLFLSFGIQATGTGTTTRAIFEDYLEAYQTLSSKR